MNLSYFRSMGSPASCARCARRRSRSASRSSAAICREIEKALGDAVARGVAVHALIAREQSHRGEAAAQARAAPARRRASPSRAPRTTSSAITTRCSSSTSACCSCSASTSQRSICASGAAWGSSRASGTLVAEALDAVRGGRDAPGVHLHRARSRDQPDQCARAAREADHKAKSVAADLRPAGDRCSPMLRLLKKKAEAGVDDPHHRQGRAGRQRDCAWRSCPSCACTCARSCATTPSCSSAARAAHDRARPAPRGRDHPARPHRDQALPQPCSRRTGRRRRRPTSDEREAA